MMVNESTVRIRPEDKRRLHDLQQAWQRVTGATATQADIVAKAVKHAQDHFDAFVAEQSWEPWSKEDIDRLLDEIAIDIPVDDALDINDEIKEVVYGEDAYERMMGRR